MGNLDEFYGPNAGYVLDLYDRYLRNPNDLDPETRAYFERHGPPREPEGAVAVQAPAEMDVLKVVGAARLARLTREYGHLAARVDPLGSPPPGDPELELSYHGLTEDDLSRLPASVVGGPLAQGAANALEAFRKLRETYSGSTGYDFDQVQVAEERDWLRDAVEGRRYALDPDEERDRALLERLTEVETFERYLHRAFPGQKWFSLEGLDVLVPMLDEIVERAAEADTREVVIGIAHRGRLNVLAHILGQPYEEILGEFTHTTARSKGTSASDSSWEGWTGDVKYHLGAKRVLSAAGERVMPITLAPNPSHLEFVDPVVEGRARAAQEDRGRPGPPRQDELASLAILIHGDAAFPGQGVVAETLNLSGLDGYRTGGTIHVIANNQLGFTTGPEEGRSTLYAGDLAKGFEIPAVHVNADDPYACLMAARLAHAYRERFQKDFLIDLIGYRRYGHNESDEPSFTQPRMYAAIAQHPTVREQLARDLAERGTVSADEAEAMVRQVTERLREAQKRATPGGPPPEPDERLSCLVNLDGMETLVSREKLMEYNAALLERPEGFTPNPKLERLIQRRREALESGTIDWGHAESLAFASILADGIPIRLTGQDTVRGTFSHRHLALYDVNTGEPHVPLQAMPQARASFAVYNSPLSESATLGFEYGYSAHAPNTLVLWEAQYGDFANVAQVIIDQFIASGQSKWRQLSGLVLLLPHGYEGQGPEHSSARLERFLQLAADDNIRVANVSTAAQYYHLLRRQAALLAIAPRPLVVMTPKSLLRHPRAASTLDDLSSAEFEPVLDDPRHEASPAPVRRLLLCSGKVYYDLTSSGVYESAEDVRIARIEELYPFPARHVKRLLASYPGLEEVVWAQEEPRNMGAWSYVALQLAQFLDPDVTLGYVGRPEHASPAEGSNDQHNAEQARIVEAALAGPPDFEISIREKEVRYAG